MKKNKDLIVWCLEAPHGNFLKEITSHASGQRLLFTDRWDDGAMKYGMKEQAKKLIKEFNLEWLNITEHMIIAENEKND